MISSEQIQIIRVQEVLAITGIPKSSLYEKIKQGLFCPQISLGARSVGFILSEVKAVMALMINGADENELKMRIANLVMQRTDLLNN